MKYFCKNCNTEIKTVKQNYSGHCPICFDCNDGRVVRMKSVPDYETPAHYEERTGKAYPDNGAVYIKLFSFWTLLDFSEAKEKKESEITSVIYTGDIVIADPPVPPPEELEDNTWWKESITIPRGCAGCDNLWECDAINNFDKKCVEERIKSLKFIKEEKSNEQN